MNQGVQRTKDVVADSNPGIEVIGLAQLAFLCESQDLAKTWRPQLYRNGHGGWLTRSLGCPCDFESLSSFSIP